jgi:transcriptional regulator with XRE-family HTH domain
MAEASPGANIGRNIRAVRERKLFSRTDLAERSGLSVAGIDQLERGFSARPRRRTIERLAEVLDVDVDTLMEEAAYPLGEALPSQDRLFNGASERNRFIKRVRAYIETRVAHYEKHLFEAEQGGFFEGYEGARILLDDSLGEFMNLPDLINGELAERWMLDPEVLEDEKVALGRAVGEAMQPFVDLLGRIAGQEKELAETEAQKIEAERRRKEMVERTRKIA